MIILDTPSGRFTYRVAGIAIVDGHVLLHKAVGQDYWILPGGRAELMEQASATLRREMLEEAGLHVNVGRLVWVTENFFAENNIRYHEIGLYFEMNTPTDSLTGRRLSFLGQEGAESIEFRWCPLDDLPMFQPHFLAGRLASLPTVTEHIVDSPPLS